MSISPRGMTVTEAYRLFRSGQFLINRAYQRKLVWTQPEKARLIDSLLKGYPIPLILLVQTEDGCYEIIDGMQRLNAIFSFIENEFSAANDRFFNVDEFITAKENAETGVFFRTESKNLLTRTECAAITEYQLAVTIFSVDNKSDVTDIFGRINSGGRQLSPQEQRQAGITSSFAAFVRQISSELRGDVSAEIVNLMEMPEISIDATSLKLGYGVRAENTFWCKQGIMRISELRGSLDEQVIADLAISILLNEPFNAAAERFDEAYNLDNELSQQINTALNAYPLRLLGDEIKTVFSALIETIEAVDNSTNAFRKIVNPSAGGNPVRTPFYAVFMAFHNLIIRQNKSPVDPKSIMKVLEGIGSTLTTSQHYMTKQSREKNINVVIGLVQNFFAHKDPPLLKHGIGLVIDFENSLRRSKIETPRYEFKQGLYILNNSCEKAKDLPLRIAEIACSMANIGPDAYGYIFLGVADKLQDAKRIAALDNIKPVFINDLAVVGVDREAKKAGQSLDEYVRSFVSELSNISLSEPLKSGLLGSIDTIEYRGVSVVRLSVPNQKQISWVGDETFVREGSSTLKASQKQVAAISDRFQR